MLLDLAADSRQTVPADLPDYIRQHDIVRAALRVAKEVDAMTKHYCAIYDADLTKNYDNFSPLAQMKASGAKIKMAAKGR